MKNKLFLTVTVLLCLFVLLFAAASLAESQPSLALDQAELTLVKGKSQKLKYTLENTENPKKAQVVWASSDEAVATVDKGGTVKAKDGGTAQITCTATLEDGSVLTASLPVTVTVPVQGVKIQTKANTAIPYGSSLQLEFSVQPDNATNPAVTWSSSNEDILRVDENGQVTAVSAGKANITGTAENGKSAKVSLYVPTLHPASDTFAVTAADHVFHFTYCGNDFDKNVQLSVKGKCFDYTLVRNDPDIGVDIIPLAPGEGTLTVTDKKDGAAKFTVAVTVTADAFPPGKLLQIQDASYDPAAGILSVSWINTGVLPATGVEFRIAPLDAAGNALVIGEGYIEEILLEERVLHTSAAAEPGKTASASFQTGNDYPAAAAMNIVIDRVEWTSYAPDGSVQEVTVQELPEDRLCWYSTGENAYLPGPENGDPYTAPDADILAAAAEAPLGFSAVAVTGDLAEAYGFAYSGIMVVSVEDDSPAEAMGLEPGDLIYAVNDIRWSGDPYFITRGLSDLAAGQPMAIQFERDNALWEATLQSAE